MRRNDMKYAPFLGMIFEALSIPIKMEKQGAILYLRKGPGT